MTRQRSIRGGGEIIEILVKEVEKIGGTAEDVRYLATPEAQEFLAHVASELVTHLREPVKDPKESEAVDKLSRGGVIEGPGFLF